jgi:hypothetical protein
MLASAAVANFRTRSQMSHAGSKNMTFVRRISYFLILVSFVLSGFGQVADPADVID